MALYPDLNAVLDSAKKKADFKAANHLAFSQASQYTTEFETVNDKVLREMNERAKKQLENKVETSVNPFKLGDGKKTRSPQKTATPIPRKRFSTLHKSQFNRMESIESHPKVVAKNSRMNLRQQYQQEAEGTSPAKRGQVKAEESPTKRLRRAPAAEPKHTPKALRPSSSRLTLRPQSSRTKLEPTDLSGDPIKSASRETTQELKRTGTTVEKAPGASVAKPQVSEYATLSKPSERVRARASQASLRTSLRGPTLERPDMREKPRQVSREIRDSYSRSLRSSVSSRELRGPRPSSTSRAPSSPEGDQDDDAMDLDSSIVSQDSPSAQPPLSSSKGSQLRPQLELPSVPKHIPSYARPTASAIRRSQSQQTLRGAIQHGPNRVASMFGALSRVPKKNPDMKR